MTTGGPKRVCVLLMLEAPETETGPDAGYGSQTLRVKEYQWRTGWSRASLRVTAPPPVLRDRFFSFYQIVNSLRVSHSFLLIQPRQRVQHLADAQEMFAKRVKKGRNDRMNETMNWLIYSSTEASVGHISSEPPGAGGDSEDSAARTHNLRSEEGRSAT